MAAGGHLIDLVDGRGVGGWVARKVVDRYRAEAGVYRELREIDLGGDGVAFRVAQTTPPGDLAEGGGRRSRNSWETGAYVE